MAMGGLSAQKNRAFDLQVRESDQVEVTLAADSKADIVSGAHYLGSEFDSRDQEK